MGREIYIVIVYVVKKYTVMKYIFAVLTLLQRKA